MNGRVVLSRSNTTLVSRYDCPGGGQVWVEGKVLYIGHQRPPHGTTIVDVSDPRNPRTLATIDIPAGWHSHKVRVCGDIMLVNHEKFGQAEASEFGGGLAIYDVSRPNTPKPISKWSTRAGGVHRFDFDGRYAYISPTFDGFVGNIMMILDLADPAKPLEVGRWWIPGQWKAGGEPYPWTTDPPPVAIIRCGMATACMSAIGITASSFSTSRNCRGQSRSRTSTPVPPFPIRPIPAFGFRASWRPGRHDRGRRRRGRAVAIESVLRMGL